MSDKLQLIKSLFEGNSLPEKTAIGRRVVLCEDGYESDDRPFFYGDELTIKAIDGRKYHLEDDNGNFLIALDKHIELI